jgi:hypothetical protein
MSKSSDWALKEQEKNEMKDESEIEQAELEYFREKAISDIKESFEEILEINLNSCKGPKEELLDVAMHNKNFHEVIWKASTETLPHLEVQVVIDGKNNCFVSTGTAGFVDFFEPPIGMTLPIRCWIHTHPFGAAYFSGTDIRTVSIWEQNMECAYVLGGIDHHGFWSKREPKQLEIYEDNEEYKIQTWGEEE